MDVDSILPNSFSSVALLLAFLPIFRFSPGLTENDRFVLLHGERNTPCLLVLIGRQRIGSSWKGPWRCFAFHGTRWRPPRWNTTNPEFDPTKTIRWRRWLSATKPNTLSVRPASFYFVFLLFCFFWMWGGGLPIFFLNFTSWNAMNLCELPSFTGVDFKPNVTF